MTKGTNWNCLWTGLIRQSRLKSMNQFQKINHFVGAWSLGSKANLWRNCQRQRRKQGKDFDICPPTYVLPDDYKRWLNDREMSNFQHMYILKPTSLSCGRGIKIIGKQSVVKNKKCGGYLISKYISNPHLLRGYKYDLRIYIVVTCFDPLKCYIYQKGLVRLATQPYSNNQKFVKKTYVHLTNYSINKKADGYIANKNNEQEQEAKKDEMSSKWSFRQLKEEYQKMGISFNDIFKKIKDLCIKTLMSVEPEIAYQTSCVMKNAKYKGQCFEIYGFDVIID